MKKAIFVFSLLLFVPLIASAYEAKTGNSVYIAKDQVVEGNLYAAGSSITVEGKVTGDVICAGQSITINGIVDGDVICAGQSIIVNGSIGGSLRSAGSAININGKVARNAYTFGANVNLGDKGEIGWDLMVGAATTEIRGKIGRTLHGGVAAADISGKIAKYVSLRVDNNQKADTPSLKIEDGAVIGGDLNYISLSEAQISDKAQIKGKVNYSLPKAKPAADKNAAAGWMWGQIFTIFSAIALGIIFVSLWPEGIKKMTDKMLEKSGASIGWGVLLFFISPLIFIALLITIIGIPLAFLFLGVYIIALALTKIFVGILIGRSLIERFWQAKKDSLMWAMIIGIVVTWIVYSIPVLGWALSLVAVWWGLGGIWLMLKKN
jgi:cytoskeletal protein CcmA (bactofilin family)